MTETTTDVHERARQALDGMRERVQQRDPEGCHNVMADLWQGYGIAFGESNDPRVRERGIRILPGLHDDRFRFLAERPALNVAYEALEDEARVVTAELLTDDQGHVDSGRLRPEPSLLEALFADFDEGSADPLADEGDLLDIIGRAKAVLARPELRAGSRRGAR
jgi:hypothetical protein